MKGSIFGHGIKSESSPGFKTLEEIFGSSSRIVPTCEEINCAYRKAVYIVKEDCFSRGDLVGNRILGCLSHSNSTQQLVTSKCPKGYKKR